MYCDAMEKLSQWKNKKNKKPLVIRRDARWENMVYISFENKQQMKDLFEADLRPEKAIFRQKDTEQIRLDL